MNGHKDSATAAATQFPTITTAITVTTTTTAITMIGSRSVFITTNIHFLYLFLSFTSSEAIVAVNLVHTDHIGFPIASSHPSYYKLFWHRLTSFLLQQVVI